MGYRVLEFRETPNPNALKVVLDRPTGPAGSPPRSFRRAEDAATDALASRLFAVAGVVNVLIQPDWLTVGKAADAPWDRVKAGVAKALADAA